jgi:mannan endo-1,4-beta-mannosidase
VTALAFLTLSGGAAARERAPLEPRAGALLGAFVASGNYNGFETLVRHRVRIWHKWECWRCYFPNDADRAAAAKGRILMYTWSPQRAGADVSLASIIRGERDRWLRRRAAALKRFAHPVFLRWAWEMNGDWNSWGCKPARYADAWRHVWRVFHAVGATNVVWVWGPNWRGLCANGAPAGFSYGPYWPGAGYVDWVGVTGYNSRFPWRSLADLTHPIRVFARDHAKPVMIAETASVEDPGSPGRKGRWISAARESIRDSWPNVGALVWFHRGATAEHRADWRVNSSTSSLRAFRALAADRYFDA